MAADGKPIVNEMEDGQMDVQATRPMDEKKRDGFHHNLVKKLSIAQMVIGVISIILGIAVEVLATKIVCEIWCYEFHVSLIGAGMWCGLMFIGVGIIGSCAAKNKSTCSIVALLVVGVFTIIFAGAQIGVSVVAAAADRDNFKTMHNETGYDGRIRSYDGVRRVLPVPLFILNIFLALLGLVMVGLLITSSVASCAATCCHVKPNYLRSNLFEAVPTSGATYSQPMQMAPQPYVMPGSQMYYAPQGYGGNTQPTMQPMVMMPMNPQAPVQYQVVGQPCPPYHGTPVSPQPTPQAAPSTQGTAQVPTQQV